VHHHKPWSSTTAPGLFCSLFLAFLYSSVLLTLSIETSTRDSAPFLDQAHDSDGYAAGAITALSPHRRERLHPHLRDVCLLLHALPSKTLLEERGGGGLRGDAQPNRHLVVICARQEPSAVFFFIPTSVE